MHIQMKLKLLQRFKNNFHHLICFTRVISSTTFRLSKTVILPQLYIDVFSDTAKKGATTLSTIVTLFSVIIPSGVAPLEIICYFPLYHPKVYGPI